MSTTFRRIKNHILDNIAKGLIAIDVSANEVTLSSFIVGVWALLMLPYQHYSFAILFLVIHRIGFILDKHVAILSTPTDKGAYLRTLLNFLLTLGFFFFFSLGYDKHGQLTSLILFSYSIAFISKRSLKLILEKRMGIEKLPSNIRLGGMLSNIETFIIMILVCLFP